MEVPRLWVRLQPTKTCRSSTSSGFEGSYPLVDADMLIHPAGPVVVEPGQELLAGVGRQKRIRGRSLGHVDVRNVGKPEVCEPCAQRPTGRGPLFPPPFRVLL